MASIMYATMEWLWDSSHIRVNLPDGNEIKTQGSYAEVVAELNRLGSLYLCVRWKLALLDIEKRINLRLFVFCFQ